MQVVERQQQRSRRRAGLDRSPHGLEQAQPPRRRLLRQARRSGRAVGKGGDDRSQPVGVRNREAPLEHAPHRVGERLVGEQRILLRAAVQHSCARGLHRGSELGEQPRLTDPGLPGHNRQPLLPRDDLPPQRLEPGEHIGAPDEFSPEAPREERAWQRWRGRPPSWRS